MLLWLAAALAAPPPPPPPPPAPAPVVMTDEQRGALFTGWATALASGNRDAAMQALTAILDDPTKAEVHGEAWAHLGDLYAESKLSLAAVGAYGRGLALDPQHAGAALEKALALVEETGEPGLVAEALGNNVGIPATGATRNEMAAIAARYSLAQGSYGPAIGILLMGDKAADGFEDVELLRGIALSQQGQYGAAVAPLLTAQAMGAQKGRDATWMNVANLNVARAYYADGNYTQAIQYYAKVERSSDFWLDAQFERAWAHFRGNDANGAMAMLFNHDAPFFADFYYPEADLLRAYALFVMCKFPDATKEMDAFVEKYTRIQGELGALSPTPEDAFADLVAFRDGEPTKLPHYLLRAWRHEARLDDALRSLERADDEAKRIGQMTGRPADLARGLIEQQRDARIRAEGQRVIARLDRAKAELADMLNGIEITRLDLLNLETQMYERAAATGTLDYGDRIGKLRDLNKRKKGFRAWPWQGEYWADELGWFVFSARPDCPESMARGTEGQDAPSR